MAKYDMYSENEGIRCPYCGDMSKVTPIGITLFDKTQACGSCDKKFKFSKLLFYTSFPDCELNGEEHELSYEHEPGVRFCLICGKCVNSNDEQQYYVKAHDNDDIFGPYSELMASRKANSLNNIFIDETRNHEIENTPLRVATVVIVKEKNKKPTPRNIRFFKKKLKIRIQNKIK